MYIPSLVGIEKPLRLTLPRLHIDVRFEVSLEDIFGQVWEEEGISRTAAKIEMLEFAGQLHSLRVKLKKSNHFTFKSS